jgi:hypothetical protein
VFCFTKKALLFPGGAWQIVILIEGLIIYTEWRIPLYSDMLSTPVLDKLAAGLECD